MRQVNAGGNMVRLLMSALMVLLWTAATPALAQMGGGKRGHRGAQKSDVEKPKVDEKAYNEALKRIPEPKEKYDPWGIARATTQAHSKK
jgi:hypothetical protein